MMAKDVVNPVVDQALRAELETMLEHQGESRRWAPEVVELVRYYHFKRGAAVGTMVRILARAHPQFAWTYAVVNGKIQAMKRKEADRGKQA